MFYSSLPIWYIETEGLIGYLIMKINVHKLCYILLQLEYYDTEEFESVNNK